MLGRRPEVPDVRLAAAGQQRVAGHLVARPLPDVGARDVADVVEVEEQDRPDLRGASSASARASRTGRRAADRRSSAPPSRRSSSPARRRYSVIALPQCWSATRGPSGPRLRDGVFIHATQRSGRCKRRAGLSARGPGPDRGRTCPGRGAPRVCVFESRSESCRCRWYGWRATGVTRFATSAIHTATWLQSHLTPVHCLCTLAPGRDGSRRRTAHARTIRSTAPPEETGRAARGQPESSPPAAAAVPHRRRPPRARPRRRRQPAPQPRRPPRANRRRPSRSPTSRSRSPTATTPRCSPPRRRPRPPGTPS